MKQYPGNIWSQSNEETILTSILGALNLLNDKQSAVEMGAGDGFTLSNTRIFKEKYGYKLYQFDINSSKEVIQSKITPSTINSILSYYGVPDDVALFSLDLDGFDYWVMKELLHGYCKPKVIVYEVNGTLDPLVPVTMPYNENHYWVEGAGNFYGASWIAFKQLLESSGYSYICQVESLNGFAVRSDLVNENVKQMVDETPPRIAKYHREVGGPWQQLS